jgi:nitrogen regulatory protein PII 2
MKEIMAFIRTNKVNATKAALAEAGFPSFSCRKCLGRGKKCIDPELLKLVLATGELPMDTHGEAITEAVRLIPKRFFIVIVPDDKVKEAVDVLINVNQTGHPGDGNFFVVPVMVSYRVRDGVSTDEA